MYDHCKPTFHNPSVYITHSNTGTLVDPHYSKRLLKRPYSLSSLSGLSLQKWEPSSKDCTGEVDTVSQSNEVRESWFWTNGPHRLKDHMAMNAVQNYSSHGAPRDCVSWYCQTSCASDHKIGNLFEALWLKETTSVGLGTYYQSLHTVGNNYQWC